jgi:hypothetical protein
MTNAIRSADTPCAQAQPSGKLAIANAQQMSRIKGDSHNDRRECIFLNPDNFPLNSALLSQHKAKMPYRLRQEEYQVGSTVRPKK